MGRQETIEVEVPQRIWERAEYRAEGTDYSAREFVPDFFYLDFTRVSEEPLASGRR